MILSEHQEQCLVVDWLDYVAVLRWPHLALVDERLPYIAIPNGGYRHVKTASDLKKEGVRKGYPDLQLMVPTKKYPGLIIEMKRVKNSVTRASQKEWIAALKKLGYSVHVCKGHQAAIDVIENYLEEKIVKELKKIADREEARRIKIAALDSNPYGGE